MQTAAWNEVSRDLTRDIEKGLDPNNAIRPGLKKIIVDKIFNEVVGEVAADAAHVARMDALWDRERKAGYRGAFKDSLKNTYLSRAKALVPRIRQRVRAEIAGSQKTNDKALGIFNRVGLLDPAPRLRAQKTRHLRKCQTSTFLAVN
jgi:hypothetical protein